MKHIIVGNGFDLSLGLKTSYEHFFKSDNFENLLVHNNCFATHLKSESQAVNNWVDIEKEIPKYSNKFFSSQIDVKEDFESFKTSLMSYLKEAQKEEINLNSPAFKMLEQELKNGVTDNIYNFNYTNSILRVAEIIGIDVSEKHSYVHGSMRL